MSSTDGASTAARLIERVDPARARANIAGLIVHTPTLVSDELSEMLGSPVALKAECLQRSGSFKLRGALNKVASIEGVAELVAASAGNHGRAVAHAARARGLACTVFMPREAAVSKAAAIHALGAQVILEGDTVEEALALARERARADDATFVHPFDDVDVIAGQGTVALELLEQVPDLARVLVPVGGGGLAAGVGAALRGARASVELIGVQAQACAPYARSLGLLGDAELVEGAGAEPAPGATIADGIAIKTPGAITQPLLGELLDGLHTVTEEEIAHAIVFLAERGKLVAEGAGAASVGALMNGRLEPVQGTTVAVVSGGNIDSGLIAGLLLRHETEEGRRVRIRTRVADRPGGLAELLSLIAGARANVIAVEHRREALPLRVRETGVEMTLETRGPDHTANVLALLRDSGYEAVVD
jgi:threonine dehydratase